MGDATVTLDSNFNLSIELNASNDALNYTDIHVQQANECKREVTIGALIILEGPLFWYLALCLYKPQSHGGIVIKRTLIVLSVLSLLLALGGIIYGITILVDLSKLN